MATLNKGDNDSHNNNNNNNINLVTVARYDAFTVPSTKITVFCM